MDDVGPSPGWREGGVAGSSAVQPDGEPRIITAWSGLALYGEYLGAMGFRGVLDHEPPGPVGALGYSLSVHVPPRVLILADDRRTLEDLGVLGGDEGLPSLLRLDEMPSSDARGDWRRRMGAKESDMLAELQRVNRFLFRRMLRNSERPGYTLDIDMPQIVAEKREAHKTCKSKQAYMCRSWLPSRRPRRTGEPPYRPII